MSVLSVKNFFAPMINKVHLVTILLIAFAFALLRMQGGAIRVERRGDSPNLRDSIRQEVEAISPHLEKSSTEGSSNRRSVENPPAKSQDKGKSSLDDIEKRLGVN